MPSAKQQPPNIKHDVGIRPNVCKLTFGPPCIIVNNVLGESESLHSVFQTNCCRRFGPHLCHGGDVTITSVVRYIAIFYKNL